MRESPQFGNSYSFFNYNYFTNDVKILLTRGQSAWVKSPSETKRSAFSSSHSFNKKTDFCNWLVGFTDSDGTFYFSQTQKGYWTFSFQISQSSYNLRALYFIKSQLKVGKITVDAVNNQAYYRVRDQKDLLKHIIPLFDKHFLLTRKYFQYECFKKALILNVDSTLSQRKKNELINEIRNKLKNIPTNYQSPAWGKLLKSKNNLLVIMTKSWLVGFVEAEGSFYITKKDSTRLAHYFEITQLRDKIVLEAIASVFALKVIKKKTHFTVVTARSSIISNIAKYFFKTMKGMKAVEYRIWSRSFFKYQNKKKSLTKNERYVYLLKIQKKMRNLRTIRLDKNFGIKNE